jgi:hypothetical protein
LPKHAGELFDVSVCREAGRTLAANPVDVLGRKRDPADQELLYQPVVALRIVRRNAALVAPEEMDPLPRQNVRETLGEQLEELARSGAPREREGKETARRLRPQRVRDALGGFATRRLGVGANADPPDLWSVEPEELGLAQDSLQPPSLAIKSSAAFGPQLPAA